MHNSRAAVGDGAIHRTGSDRTPASAPENWGPISINLEEIDYPYPVSYLNFRVYNQDVRLAYMDVAPTGRINGRTVILHHGGLYYGWYWEKQIAALAAQGYRVIVKTGSAGVNLPSP